MRAAGRQTRPKERLIRPSEAEAPEGVQSPEAMAIQDNQQLQREGFSPTLDEVSELWSDTRGSSASRKAK